MPLLGGLEGSWSQPLIYNIRTLKIKGVLFSFVLYIMIQSLREVKEFFQLQT